MTLLYYNMKFPGTLAGPLETKVTYHNDMTPFSLAWTDCGEAVRCAVEVELSRLASRCETFFTFSDIPHDKFRSDKIQRVLGFRPRYHLEAMWNKAYPEAQ
jgi:hypothetical protein